MELRRQKRVKQWNKARVKSVTAAKFWPPQEGVGAYTYDISLQGARLYSEELFPVGSVIRLNIELVRLGRSIGLDAEVKWVSRNEQEHVYEFGVEFRHTQPQTIAFLMKNLYDEGAGIRTSVV